MYKILRCDPKLFEKDLSDHVYVVTGANSGIGLTMTEQLVRQEAHVAGTIDRIMVEEDGVQLYGTQFGMDEDSKGKNEFCLISTA